MYKGKETIWSQDYNPHSQGQVQGLEKVEDRERYGMDISFICVDVCLVAETWVMR